MCDEKKEAGNYNLDYTERKRKMKGEYIMPMNQKAIELHSKQKMNLIKFGLTIAFVAAMSNTIFQNFNVAATGIISEGFVSTLLAAYVLSVMTLGICELIGGLIAVGFNASRGIPLAEYGRVWGVKSSRTILISAILGGPIATAAAVMAIALCGSTYANAVIGLTPVVTAIFGILFLKEKAGLRVFAGILICTAGVIVATLSPPEGVTNFYLGIALVAICPIAYTLESIISTHAIDVSDPMLACPLYRMIGSAIMEFIIVILVCAVTGHMAWIGLALSILFSSPLCMFFILCTAIFMAIQYNGTYTSYAYCGAIKASAILWTGAFWTIPIGFAMEALNILDYNVTPLGIVGAVAVVVGILLVVAKPSELFSLRSE